MSRYVGLTIGPIIKTISSARKTGELWASSYIFSYIMKKLIYELKENYKFIVPYTKNDKLFTEHKEIGIFHDRFMFKIENNETFEETRIKLDKKIEEILNSIADNISSELKKDENKVRSYVKKYFKIYYASMEIKEDVNPILHMMKALDALELREKFTNEVEENYLENYFVNENIKRSLLMTDAFGEKQRGNLPSILHIAIADHAQRFQIVIDKVKGVYKELEIDEDEIYDVAFKEIKTKLNKENIFRKPYNYAAIVQGDADNMGAMIKKLWNKDKFEEFSKTMMEFSIEAKKIVDKYKGFTLYAGGDDLLFFSPVIYDGKTVFHLVEELSNKFNSMFKEFNQGAEKPFTYSFGVFIFYYKYPLYEALGQARELLFDKAKKYKCKDSEKNSVAFGYRKHSGNITEVVISKDSNAYKMFLSLITEYFKDEKFLKSIVMKLNDYQEVIKLVLDDENKVQNFFINNFNEDIHKEKDIEKFIKLVSKFISDTAVEYCVKKDEKKELDESKEKVIKAEIDKNKERVIKDVYSILSFIKFLNEKGE